MGGTPKWLVYNGTSHLEMDDDWGYPCDLGNHHMGLNINIGFGPVPDVLWNPPRWPKRRTRCKEGV